MAQKPKTQQFNLRRVVREAEKRTVLAALHHSGHRMDETATLLGVSRPTLYAVIDRCDMWGEVSALRKAETKRRENPAP